MRQLTDLPAMMTAVVALAAAAGVARISAVLAREPRGRWHDSSLAYWLGGVGGLVAALYCYFAALAWGDPARIALVTYLWPVVFVVGANWLAGRGVRLRVLLGMAIAFAGVAPLVAGDGGGAETPLPAYGLGLLSGGAWAFFSVYLRQAGTIPFRGYARLFGQAALLALGLYLLTGQAGGSPEPGDWLAAALIGIGPYGIAFMTWGFALRQGPTDLLGVMTYMVPVISAVLLVLTGYSEPEPMLLVATLAVVGGALLSTTREQKEASAGEAAYPDADREAGAAEPALQEQEEAR